MTPLFVQILKTRNPLILGGGNYYDQAQNQKQFFWQK